MREEFIHLNKLDADAFSPSVRWASLILTVFVVATFVFEAASQATSA